MSNPYRYIMKIEYNEEAKAFIENLRALGKREGFRVRVRGSGARAPQNRDDGLDLRHFDQSLPLEHATHVRLYLDSSKSDGEGYVGSGWIGLDWRSQLA